LACGGAIAGLGPGVPLGVIATIGLADGTVEVFKELFIESLREVIMNNTEIALIIIITILIILVFASIVTGFISSKMGGIIMLIAPFLINFLIIMLWGDKDLIDALSIGILLSLAFGPATFVIGNILEKKAKENKVIN
jgi:hypothetical protein